MRPAPAGLCVAGVIVAAAVSFSSRAAQPGFATIAVHAHPITAFRRGQADDLFGRLTFRGGLVLSSPSSDFGGWSGLDFDADDKTIYAVSDTGAWMAARLVRNNGRLIGVADVRLAPILDVNGKPLVGKVNSDAEGLRITRRDGVETALVSFEQTPAVEAFAAAPDFATTPPRHLILPRFVNHLPTNQGLEAIAVAPIDSPLVGATVVIAERSLDRNGDHRGFVLDGPLAGPFFIRRSSDFDVTDAAFLPDGDLLILERKFSFAQGFAMRIRRIAAHNIRPGTTADGAQLINADDRDEIDNMEGMAVRTDNDGETVIDLISDDNHSLLQRTILLQFVLNGSAPPPRPRLAPSASSP